MVERELLTAFEKHGIRRLDPLGQKFDPEYHQAMYELETAERPAGTVAEVLQPGYVMHDRQIGRAHVCTPVTHEHLVFRILLEKKNTHTNNTTQQRKDHN